MDEPTQSLIPLLALLSPAALVLAALVAWAQAGPRPRGLERLSLLVSWIGVVVAPVLIGFVALEGTLVTPLVGEAGLGLSLRLDTLSLTIFTMVALLGVVIVRFSRTYLDGDPAQGAFLGRLCATIAAVETLVISGNLVLFFLAWVATSFTLHRLLVFYADRRGAVIAARKKFIAARLGDAVLLAAFVLIYGHFGTGELSGIFAGASTVVGAPLALSAAAALLAVAALLKSAQFPTHGWLVEVMETPTPVSALLHAGILNAGPFLIVRFAAMMGFGALAPITLVVVGGFTALFASVVLLTQPSVKVALGYSSAAHMGFMLLVCGLGVYPAAILHLVAHSFYKAHAFLSSGSAVESAVAGRVAVPKRLRSAGRLFASLALAAAIYFGLAGAFGVEPANDTALLAVGAILVLGLTQLIAPAVDAEGHASAMVRVAGLAGVVAVAFFALEALAAQLLEPALPERFAPAPVTLALVGVVLLAFAAAVGLQIVGAGRSRWGRVAYVHLRNGLYANAAFDRLIGAFRR